MTKQWFAVCTRPQHELKLAATLTKKGIDNFCPQTRRMLVSNGFRKKINWSPVFHSFVFVHITEAEISTVLRTNDVVNFMYWMGKPAVIAEADIRTIEQFTSRYPNVTVQKTAVIKNGLAVANEVLVNSELHGEEHDENISVAIPSLGYILTASREKNYRIINRNIESGRIVQ